LQADAACGGNYFRKHLENKDILNCDSGHQNGG
jgi:hypothetical protein